MAAASSSPARVASGNRAGDRRVGLAAESGVTDGSVEIDGLASSGGGRLAVPTAVAAADVDAPAGLLALGGRALAEATRCAVGTGDVWMVGLAVDGPGAGRADGLGERLWLGDGLAAARHTDE